MREPLITRSIRLVKDDYLKLNFIAEKNNLTTSDLVRAAIKEYIKYR